MAEKKPTDLDRFFVAWSRLQWLVNLRLPAMTDRARRVKDQVTPGGGGGGPLPS